MPLPKGTPLAVESEERAIRARTRAKAKEVFGEKAIEGKEIHHKNGNNVDNSPGNMEPLTKEEHAKKHGRSHGRRGSKNIRNKCKMGTMNIWTDGLQLTDNGAEPKEDIMLFPFGEFEHPSYGKMTFDNNFFNEIIDNYQANVLHVKPFMDMQHDENKSLAWFDSSPFIRPGLGLYIKPDYTELGQSILSKRTYRYFSPSWGSYKDPETQKEFKNVLRGGAATNIPFLKTMPSIIDETAVLDNRGMAEYKLSELTIKGSPEKVGPKADNIQGRQTPKSVKKLPNKKLGAHTVENEKLVEKFGLSADASEDSILAKIDELLTSNKGLGEKVTKIEAEAKKAKELADKENSKKTLTDTEVAKKLEDSNKKVGDLEVKLNERDRDEAINKAITDGKLLPKDKEYYEKRYMADPVNVKEDLLKMSKIVDLDEKGSAGKGEEQNLSDDPGTQMVVEANKKMAESKCTFDEAVTLVCAENSKLAEAYTAKYQL
jgi:phage I-like protein